MTTYLLSRFSLKSLSRQTGGTVLGLIVGLIVGLSIAVLVALTINKTTLPFLNKPSKPDRVELTPAQASDPNKPLYGSKAAAREAARDFATPAAPVDATPPNAVDPQAVKNAAAKEVSVTPPAEKVKKADVAKNAEGASDKPAVDKSAADKTATDDKWTYFLQAGAFREQADAESARAKLALLGFEARISERPSDNGTLYRVRVGPFGQLDTMNRMRGKLTDNGVDVAVVRTPKNP